MCLSAALLILCWVPVVPELDEDDDEGEGEEEEDEDEEDGDRERRRRSQGTYSLHSNKVTNKATMQAKEQVDERLAGKQIPPRPMLELEAGSNVWYQAYVMKTTINEVKVRFPGEAPVMDMTAAADCVSA